MTRLLIFLLGLTSAWAAVPKTVHFESLDGKTKLVAYLFVPQFEKGAKVPAIVMLHGRAGPYSSLANGVYNATTLSKRHQEWGELWASRGYYALLVDSFGPRGYPAGFPLGSYDDRPAEVSEQTVRPFDAYAGLKYLRSLPGVNPKAIGVQGWSNGGMTVLVTMNEHSPGIEQPTPLSGFRAALAEYPGCGMEAIQEGYHNYAPLLMLLGSADEEVSPERCEKWAAKVKKNGNSLETVVFAGAEHNYDDPGKKKQSNPANQKATEETIRRAQEFFAEHLR